MEQIQCFSFLPYHDCLSAIQHNQYVKFHIEIYIIFVHHYVSMHNQWTASPVWNNKCQRKAELWTKLHSNHLAVGWCASYASIEINAVAYDLFHIFYYIFNNRFHTRA